MRLDDVTLETVGERLRRLRHARGLSQRALAMPGVTYAYISRIESGDRQPSVKALRQLARRLDVTPAYLETGRDLDDGEDRELRIADAELALRLGDAVNAEQRLRDLAAEALAVDDRASAARARIALALVADERGDHAAAVVGLEDAFALDRPSPLERVDVFTTLGRAYVALGRTDAAIELYRGCLDEASRLPLDRAGVRARYRIMLGYALSDAGRLEEAEAALRDASHEVPADDPYMRVRVHWSLARLSEMEGRSAAALRYARRAIALLEATEDSHHRARAHLLAAWISNSAADADRAGGHLEAAERLFGRSANADDAAMLAVERSRTEALRGNGAAAVRLAREAIDGPAGQYKAVIGSAYCALAEGLALEGSFDEADGAFRQGLELLVEQRRWREARLACRAWAHALRNAGRDAAAFEVLDRATQLGPPPPGEPVRSII